MPDERQAMPGGNVACPFFQEQPGGPGLTIDLFSLNRDLSVLN